MRTKRPGFTLVELLTVMSIIIILITLLIPALTRVKQYARRVKQHAQFKSIRVALEMFNNEWDMYPDSDEKDEADQDYCGAMKLCEALMGKDLLGFHPFSRFRRDGQDNSGTDLYPPKDIPSAALFQENLKIRKGPYLELENANAYNLRDIYGQNNAGVFDEDDEELYVLCDVYSRVRLKSSSGKTGMPILYYKADPTKTEHDITKPEENIYDYRDNEELVMLGKPWLNPPNSEDHPLYKDPALTTDWEHFYEATKSDIIKKLNRPYNEKSYILISAGYDGEYGTPDDVFNF